MTREEMKIEAMERMKKLELHENVLRDFEEDDKLNMSENGGFLYWLNDEHEKMIRNWEKESGNMAYHLIRSFTNIGEMISILFVGTENDEWKYEKSDIKNGYVFSYVMNIDEPMFSEYGSIKVRKSIGGLVRVG